LRERKAHLEKITNYLVDTISRRLGKEPKIIPSGVMKEMIDYLWPGNIRELENIIERSIIVSKGSELHISGMEDISLFRQDQKISGDLKAIEKEAIKNALSHAAGNRKRAAEMLGISLRSLHYKIKEYGIT
jgi:transcriptional regulator with PAS, ATPase and Fis domain